jgi:hypothetical protein
VVIFAASPEGVASVQGALREPHPRPRRNREESESPANDERISAGTAGAHERLEARPAGEGRELGRKVRRHQGQAERDHEAVREAAGAGVAEEIGAVGCGEGVPEGAGAVHGQDTKVQGVDRQVENEGGVPEDTDRQLEGAGGEEGVHFERDPLGHHQEQFEGNERQDRGDGEGDRRVQGPAQVEVVGSCIILLSFLIKYFL